MVEHMVFDIGNGFVKAKSKFGEIIAPSSFALESKVGDSSIGNIFNGNENLYNSFESSLDDGVKYIWGEELRKAVKPEDLIHTYTHENRYANKRFKLLSQFVLAELASQYKEDSIDVVLVTGLPSAEIKTEDDVKLKEFLKGKHLVKRNGVEKVINVIDVRILEQPLGTLLNMYLKENGEMHKNLLSNTITVIDFGSGTTIIDTFKNMKRIEGQSETIYKGMNDIYRNIQQKVATRYNIKSIDIVQIEEGIRNDFNLVISTRKQYPFEEEAKEAIRESLDQIISNIDRIISNRDSIDEFVLTGGGAEVLGDVFRELFMEESLISSENSQIANMNGYNKFAEVIVKQTS